MRPRELAAVLVVTATAACYGSKVYVEGGGGGAGGTSTDPCAGLVCDDQNPCTADTCEAGACQHVPGVATLPDPEDCKQQSCDGATLVESDDDTEKPPDGNPCTTDGCFQGEPAYNNLPAGTACNGTGICDASGNCSACSVPSDCGMDTPCGTRTCDANSCGWDLVPGGVLVDNGTPADCTLLECNGTDETPTPVTGDDPLVDGDPCTDDLCVNGTPQNPSSPSGAPCPDGSPAGGQCNDAGVCADCTTSAGCSAGDVCNAQVCCTPVSQAVACGADECGTEPQGCGLPDHVCGTCSAPTPICSPQELCVECVTDAHCAGNVKGNDCLNSGVCGCNGNADCGQSLAGKVCNFSLETCGCFGNADCESPENWGDSCNSATNVCHCVGNLDCDGGLNCSGGICQ